MKCSTTYLHEKRITLIFSFLYVVSIPDKKQFLGFLMLKVSRKMTIKYSQCDKSCILEFLVFGRLVFGVRVIPRHNLLLTSRNYNICLMPIIVQKYYLRRSYVFQLSS